MRLENKVAIITGGAVGIGLGIAERFVVEGAKVLLFDVDGKALQEAVTKIGRGPGTVQQFCGDATSAADVSDAVALAMREFKQIDILVNNVGVFTTGKLHELTEDAWDRTMEVNLKSVYLFSREVFLECWLGARARLSTFLPPPAYWPPGTALFTAPPKEA